MSSRFQIGDEVSFLNEKQDGKVIALKTDGIVVVEIEEGFSLDAPPSALVLIRRFENKPEPDSMPAKPDSEPSPDHTSTLLQLLAPEQFALVTVPVAGSIHHGPLHVYLVNRSAWKIPYRFARRKGELQSEIACGCVDAMQVNLLFECSREEAAQQHPYVMECLFSSETEKPAEPSSYHDRLKLPLPGMVQRFPELPSPFSFVQTLLLHEFRRHEAPPSAEMLKKLSQSFQDRSTESEDLFITRNHTVLNPTRYDREVDLHIEELSSDFAGLTNTQIIDLQMACFRKKLDQALINHQPGIIFIHGLGNGRLKNLIRAELKQLNLQFRDAPYERYGAGATEVLLH